MKTFFNDLKFFLEKIDHYRDELLFLFIKPYWPRKISPNQITYVRIVTGVLLFILLFFFGIENKFLILSLFCVGTITDLFDGSVARGLNKVTEFGAMLDPLADRVLILPIAVYVLYKNYIWLLIVLLCLEAISALATLYYRTRGILVNTNISGKTKMVLQSIAFILILFTLPAASIFSIITLWASVIFAFADIFFKGAEFITIKKGSLL